MPGLDAEPQSTSLGTVVSNHEDTTTVDDFPPSNQEETVTSPPPSSEPPLKSRTRKTKRKKPYYNQLIRANKRRRKTTTKKPKETPESPTAQMSGQDTPLICGICMDKGQELVKAKKRILQTSCGHTFCIPCFSDWKTRCAQTHWFTICPCCRNTLGRHQLRMLQDIY